MYGNITEYEIYNFIINKIKSSPFIHILNILYLIITISFLYVIEQYYYYFSNANFINLILLLYIFINSIF